MTNLLTAPEARPELPAQASAAAEIAVEQTVRTPGQNDTIGTPADFDRFAARQDIQKTLEGPASKTEDTLRFNAAQELRSPYAEHYPSAHQTDRDLEVMATDADTAAPATQELDTEEPEIGSQAAFDKFANGNK